MSFFIKPPHSADLSRSSQPPFQVELVGGSLPENLKELSLERPDRLRVEYQEVLWQFQVPETPLETEQGETKVMAWSGEGWRWRWEIRWEIRWNWVKRSKP